MAPKALSLAEIRQFMLDNGCKVTNHALVKYFKPFLTQPATQTEARKQFKTYVNILATIKNENNQKYLVLRKKYLHECPTEDMVKDSLVDESVPCSPGGLSLNLDAPSPYRAPPPYKPPPQVAIVSPTNKTIPSAAQPSATGLVVDQEHADTYGECVNEFAAAVRRIDNRRTEESEPKAQSISRLNSLEEQNKENVPRFSFSSGTSNASTITVTSESSETTDVTLTNNKEQDITDNPISVKEATRIFNRMFSEEEAKILSPSAKKKPEKQLIEEKELPEVTLAHPKAKEWIVAMAKASYQELAKLANEHPELVKLQDPATGYTAIHWAAKHGNEDVVKLIAGTYKADVNARTNGGYTPLHLAMQFGRVNIFELLCNVYKANRDLMDWSGNKPLDYSKQRTTVSALTYSKIKARRKNTVEKDLGFLRIGSLNVRVKKTTEAFSNFLGVGNGNGNIIPTSNPPHRHHHHAHHRHRAGMTNPRTHHHHYRFTAATAKAEHLSMKSQKGMNNQRLGTRASVPINTNNLEKFHKSWTSADNLPITNNTVNTEMPPPKVAGVKKRQKSIISMPSSTHTRCSMGSNTTDSPRDSISSSNSSSNLHSGYSSMPTTPNQLRAPIGLSVNVHGDDDTDSDSACGFGSNWSVGGRNSLSNGNIMQKPKFS